MVRPYGFTLRNRPKKMPCVTGTAKKDTDDYSFLCKLADILIFSKITRTSKTRATSPEESRVN